MPEGSLPGFLDHRRVNGKVGLLETGGLDGAMKSAHETVGGRSVRQRSVDGER